MHATRKTQVCRHRLVFVFVSFSLHEGGNVVHGIRKYDFDFNSYQHVLRVRGGGGEEGGPLYLIMVPMLCSQPNHSQPRIPYTASNRYRLVH